MQRRQFLHTASWLAAYPLIQKVQGVEAPFIMTVNGRLPASEMGISLIHEHIMVDFIGAAQWKPGRYNADTVIDTVLPFLQEVIQQRVNTFVDCTPAFLGRDVQLLQRLSKRTGLQIITNTGYYGASKEKFIPAKVYTLTPEAIAAEWIKEYEEGIEGTGIRPGFIKTGVDGFPLSKVQQKLVHAVAITHLKTGLPIAIHTGSGDASLEEIRILQAAGVDPVAYIWVHAQSEKEKKYHFKVAGAMTHWANYHG